MVKVRKSLKMFRHKIHLVRIVTGSSMESFPFWNWQESHNHKGIAKVERRCLPVCLLIWGGSEVGLTRNSMIMDEPWLLLDTW